MVSSFFRKKQSDSKAVKLKTAAANQQFDNDIDIVNTQPLSSNYRRFAYGATGSEHKSSNSVCEDPEIFSKLDKSENKGEPNTNDTVVLIHNEVPPEQIS